jgi:hypothetical protein
VTLLRRSILLAALMVAVSAAVALCVAGAKRFAR